MSYVASGYWADGYTEGDTLSLVIQNGLHGHTADNLTLGTTTNTALVVADALHGHTADGLTLGTTGTVSLTVNDATHATLSDEVALTLRSVLAIDDALHAHLADEVAEEAPAEPNGLTQAGVIPKIWPGLSVRYEGKRQKVDDLESEDRIRIEQAAADAVIQAAEESSKKAMRASIQASMRAAEVELSAAALTNLLTQAAAYQQEMIEEEQVAIAMILM